MNHLGLGEAQGSHRNELRIPGRGDQPKMREYMLGERD